MRALRTPLLPALAVSTLLLLVAGCVGQDGDRASPGAPATSSTRTQGSRGSNTPSVKVSAQGDGGAAALTRATKAATPELRRFLTRYIDVAFAPSASVDPGNLGKLFDEPVRRNVAGDLSALSLGKGGGRVSSVTLDSPTATAALLAKAGKPLAATVRFKVDGNAATERGTAAFSLRSTFQLLRGGAGWTIVAYDSQAKVPA